MDAKDLKELLGQRAKEIISAGLNLNPNHSGMAKCPLHDDKKPSMSWFNNGMMWRCHACGGQIDIYKYYADFEYLSFVQAKEKVMDLTGETRLFEPTGIAAKKSYNIPVIETRPLSQEAIDLMEVRKITKQTLDDWGIKEASWNGSNVYVFPYHKEQNTALTHVTYREIKSKGFKGGCEKGTEPILWGMDHTLPESFKKPLVITEGQPDAMAVWQSGYTNVVSAPSGANNLTWINTCWEWLKGREIIVWADNDKPGLEFAEKIKQKLENVKTFYSDLPKGKDANEVLYTYGPEKVLELINNVINEMPEGIKDTSRILYKPTILGGIETGFLGYDSYVEDWKEGDLTVVFGRNGEGKTTFISQIIAHCIEKRVPSFLYSGEMSEFKIQDWIYRQLVGNKKQYMDKVEAKYKIKEIIKPEIVKRIKEWHESLFYIYDRTVEASGKGVDVFFQTMELAAKRYGVKIFFVDNLMSRLEENADSLNSDQANFTERCKTFARTNSVHLVLVCHPNKMKGEITSGSVGNLGKTDISGTGNIGNKADNIIAVERNWGEEKDWDAIITSLKDREAGERKAIKYFFSQRTLSFYNRDTTENKSYGWEGNTEQEVIEIQEQCPWTI